jgi:RNA polymerase sigma-70 factor (ECF subfamily)
MEDRDLIAHVLAGDSSAAEMLVRRYRFVVMSALRRFRTLTPSDVDDLFQDVFERLFENECAVLRAWRGQTDLAAYIRRIATNRALDHLRSCRSAVDDEPLDDPDGVVGDGEDPQTVALAGELRRMMVEAIQQLAPPYAEVIQAVDREELTYSEAAERLGVTRNNLGVRLHHARAALARVITDRYPALMAWLRDAS